MTGSYSHPVPCTAPPQGLNSTFSRMFESLVLSFLEVAAYAYDTKAFFCRGLAVLVNVLSEKMIQISEALRDPISSNRLIS